MTRWGRALRAAAVALATAALVAEVGLRAIVADAGWLDVMRFDPPPHPRSACFGLQPGARAVFAGAWSRIPASEIRVNQWGLRDPERPSTREAGSRRILMMGDSQVFGLGVDERASLPRQTESRLHARWARTVEVINAGVPGYDLPKEVDALGGLVARFAPDLVLFVLDPNDLDRVPCARWRNQARPLVRGSVLLRAFYFAAGGGRPPDPSPATMRRVLGEEIVRIRTTLGATPFALVALGPLPGVPGDVTLIDLSTVHGRLRGAPERYVIEGDGHLNAAGLAALSDALADAL